MLDAGVEVGSRSQAGVKILWKVPSRLADVVMRFVDGGLPDFVSQEKDRMWTTLSGAGS